MHTGDFFVQLLGLIAIAALGVAVFQRLGLPEVAGFLVMGALVGPGGLGLFDDPEGVQALAEFGVVFLLFQIGLELPVDRVRRLWRSAAAAGALQVGLTVSIVAGLARVAGADWPLALVTGALVAMSSTALVMGQLAERGEVEAPHGQLALGILLFQDLCIVPFLLLVPILAGEVGSTLRDVGLALGKAGAAIAVLYLVARFAVPPLLDRVARLRSRDLFSLVALLLVVGFAVGAESLGLTLAVGAFIGGLVSSSSPYAHQLFSEVLPLRGVLIGLFFTAVGMLLDPLAAAMDWQAVLGYVVGVIGLKSLVVVAVVALVLRGGVRLGVLTGLALAQTGEFSFVLAAAASAAGILGESAQQVFVAGSVLTLIATPFLIRLAPRLASRAGATLDRGREVRSESELEALRDHGVVIGFGIAGRNVARVLRAMQVPYVVVEANPSAVSEATEAGEKIVYGDAVRLPMLQRIGVERARIVVIAVSDPVATREIVGLARSLSNEVRILARTRYILEVDPLQAVGADVVVSEEFEGSIDLVSEVLRICELPQGSIDRFTAQLREEGYEALRAPAGQAMDPWLAELLEVVSTEWVEVPFGFGAASLETLAVRARTGTNVLAVDRDGDVTANPSPGLPLQAGDRLLVFGEPKTIAALRALLEEAGT